MLLLQEGVLWCRSTWEDVTGSQRLPLLLREKHQQRVPQVEANTALDKLVAARGPEAMSAYCRASHSAIVQ